MSIVWSLYFEVASSWSSRSFVDVKGTIGVDLRTEVAKGRMSVSYFGSFVSRCSTCYNAGISTSKISRPVI